MKKNDKGKKGELRGELRRLQDLRKNFHCLEDEKGRLIDPAADGERAVKLDDMIDKIKGIIRGQK